MNAYSLRHWLLLQLQGFLALIPLVSMIVLGGAGLVGGAVGRVGGAAGGAEEAAPSDPPPGAMEIT